MNEVGKRFFYTLIVSVLCFAQAWACHDTTIGLTTEETATDSVQTTAPEHHLDSLAAYKPSGLTRFMSGMEKFFMGCDTNYVTPQK